MPKSFLASKVALEPIKLQKLEFSIFDPLGAHPCPWLRPDSDGQNPLFLKIFPKTLQMVYLG